MWHPHPSPLFLSNTLFPIQQWHLLKKKLHRNLAPPSPAATRSADLGSRRVSDGHRCSLCPSQLIVYVLPRTNQSRPSLNIFIITPSPPHTLLCLPLVFIYNCSSLLTTPYIGRCVATVAHRRLYIWEAIGRTRLNSNLLIRCVPLKRREG